MTPAQTGSHGHAIDVLIIGGGMITHDLLLPCIYHLQRQGVVNAIDICALNSSPLKALRDSKMIQQAFPGQSFTPHPGFDTPESENHPDLYLECLKTMKPRQAVVVAMPDPLHYPVVKAALEHYQHVLCVKPLVLKYDHAVEIEAIAREKGLFVGVEYHKRFDRRALLAKRHYAEGHFGEFIIGEAKMIEPYYYRLSNFQNWFTCENTDPFVYVGCHYVDLVCFITGLRPVAVSVNGIKGTFPNGKVGYFWANGRVIFENGAILSVTDGLGYPDDGAGSNEQCLEMFCEGNGKTGLIKHDDQFRGVTHSYLEGIGCAGSIHNFVSPDFFQLVPWHGPGYEPIGYGYDSVANIIGRIHAIENAVAKLPEADALEMRRRMIREIDEKGIIATPANSNVNELVTEAARMSILRDGDMVNIVYDSHPHVEPRHA
ncbi:MAG TPA: Gfo/Idh/MocA family oxidoreductase [Candidatus Hydrogenedentes bacterium]|nr:Gfo/Idh/MocA family oxidoreductase [Candidatus Hydrogenedentota bacterium]HOL75576.1 Gfo/Idh/MocA family oxidoreductase [Candidatus Hydrogenedentota bacterium]HPO87000.1 Gfo/Idh/MocA family oxidoreductase [Candidatus Hydrogenedentota bacterium]